MALKIDSELDTLFTKINGEQSGFGGFYRRLHQLENGFLFCGYGNLWSPTSAYTSSIVKTNANFEIDCKRYTQTIWVENLDFPESLTSTMTYQASIGYVWQSLDSTGTKNVVIEDGCPEQNDEDNGNGNDGGDALGLDAQSEESLVQAYPNPTTGSIRINVSSKLKNGGVEVFNPIGVLIDRKSIMSYDYIDFVLPEIQGVYLIRLSAPDGFSETLKVIKE